MKLENLDIEIDNKQKPGKQSWQQVLLSFGRFVRNHKRAVLIIVALVVIAISVYFITPVIPMGDSRIVNLGSEVKLNSGQTASLKNANVSVKIIHFTNDVCPEGQKCFGESKKGVEYLLTIDGQQYAVGSLLDKKVARYQIDTISSDYETYAVIKIVKSE